MTEPAFSPLDSQRFGIRVYRARISDEVALRHTLTFWPSGGIDLLIARCPIERLDLIQRLQASGFFLCDTLICYGGATARFSTATIATNVQMSDYRPSDREELESVARAAFRGFSGHYHSDPRLDPEKATEGYVEWAVSVTTDSAFFVQVARIGECVSGFITVRRNSPLEGEVVLNAVHPIFQRRGVYANLFTAAGVRLQTSGAERIVVAGPLSNWAPQKVWLRCGLEPFTAYYTFHRWY